MSNTTRMETKRKFDFSDFSVGDVATYYTHGGPYMPAHTSRGLVSEINNDTITVSGSKVSYFTIVFDRDGKAVNGKSYELLGIETRSDEEKQRQTALRESYKVARGLYEEAREKRHKEMMELLKPFIDYVKENDVRFTLDTTYSIPGFPPHVNLTIHSLPCKKQVDDLYNLIDP